MRGFNAYEKPGNSKQKWFLGGAAIVALYLVYTMLWGAGAGRVRHAWGSLHPPDGDVLVNRMVQADEREAMRLEASRYPTYMMSQLDYEWLELIARGWASPLKGFMTEAQLLETMHFASLSPPADAPPGTERISSPVPAILPLTDSFVQKAGDTDAITLLHPTTGAKVAILRSPEFYEFRKEEVIAHTWGAWDKGHPYVAQLLAAGPWLCGGEVDVFEDFTHADGLDRLRLSPAELRAEFADRGADAVVAFQTRNPTHAAHAFLMKESLKLLKERGFKRPILWLSPLGGYTKDDDVPLDVRVRQHEAIITEGMLPKEDTVIGIFPGPMPYAGPRDVIYQAKSRRNAGAAFFITGRDPSGIKRSDDGEDTYKGTDGKFVLSQSPGLNGMEILTFPKISYDKTIEGFTYYDKSRADDFISISGTKMRALAREGKDPPAKNFMSPAGWAIVVEYYRGLQQAAA